MLSLPRCQIIFSLQLLDMICIIDHNNKVALSISFLINHPPKVLHNLIILQFLSMVYIINVITIQWLYQYHYLCEYLYGMVPFAT